jgi:hypothetical protein
MTSGTCTSSDESQEWSCGICTYLNRPLFLSCEMCGQARPSQRPCPPRRQPSLEAEGGDLELPIYSGLSQDAYSEHVGTGTNTSTSISVSTRNSNSGMDRAPRSVQRYRSTINITGTLIMTDDPNDYESQDGKKKPGTVAEDGELDLELEGQDQEEQLRVQDPTMDESIDILEDPAPHRFSERPRSRRGRSRSSSYTDLHTNEPPRRHASRESAASMPVSSSHQHQAPPSRRKAYPSLHGSQQTQPTQLMGSSSSRMEMGMGMEDSATIVSDISNISGSLRRPLVAAATGTDMGRSERSLRNMVYHQPQGHAQRQSSIHDLHWQQRNGLPVITGPPRTAHLMGDNSYTSRPASDLHQARRPSSSQLMMNSSMRSLMSGPPAHHHPHQQQQQQQRYYQDTASRTSLRKVTSAAAFPSSCSSSSDFLPPIAPPPVPIVDMPTDVNVMEVFVKDHQAAERRASTSIDNGRHRSTAVSVRKGRASMLDNLARNNNFTSIRSIASSTAPSMRSMPQASLESTRTIGAEQAPVVPACAMIPPADMFMLQNEALDSPNTRKEKLKERRKMKGAVRSILATMRITTR